MVNQITLDSKIAKYKSVLENTIQYRKDWNDTVKPMLLETLEKYNKMLELPRAEVAARETIENLESVVLDLGKSSSGISENDELSGVKRTMIKSNGTLIYQQLFNGKIMVMLLSPNIEGYGQPKPPVTLEILRPDELKKAFITRHFEAFLKDITDWEDFDDDEPQKAIGFTPIGFHTEEKVISL